MASRVFVNYRRDDARDMAARVRDRLAATFGNANVFMDVDNLMAGQRFDRELEKALAQTDVLLAVIGPRWMELFIERQGSPERDYVREEIAGALKRGVIVIPLVVDRTPLPHPDQLPADIRDLVFHQKHVVTHEQFGRDLSALVDAIRFSQRKPKSWTWGVVAAGVAVVLAAGGAGAMYLSGMPWLQDRSAEVASAPAPASAPVKTAPAAPVKAAPAPPATNRPPAAPKADARPAPAKTATQGADPPVVLEREYRLRLASSFPKSMTALQDPAGALARSIDGASSGKLNLAVYPAGEIVPALSVLDATQNGTVDLGWTLGSYYWGKDPAFAVIGGSVPTGLDATKFVGWLRGSGKAVRDQFYAQFGVKAFPCSVLGARALFLKKPLSTTSDLRGLKLRASGVAAQALSSLGVAPTLLPGSELYPALERGVIDGGDWLTPPEDEKLGFTKIAKHYFYPFGEPTFSNVVDLLVNKAKWDQLEPAAQQIIEGSCAAQLIGSLQRMNDGVAAALASMAKAGAVVAMTPEPVNTAYVRAVSGVLNDSIKSKAGVAVLQSLKSVQ